MADFTHFNPQGRAHMVDVSNKDETERTAVATSSIQVSEGVYQRIESNQMDKGDVLSVAQVAGIMAAKNTSDWIPMCHPLPLTNVDISFNWITDHDRYVLHIETFVKTKGKTGVEMEALTAATATALTIYDMCKAVDKGMVIGETSLLEKRGGKSGDYYRK